ncbi:putative dihydroorotase [Podosphaera aphanis]|nr:putative dihydroorotase [Podosphaera aphanis]
MALLDKFDGLRLPASADFHVHLRDEAMMEVVAPTIRSGGVNTVYVMPNLNPPLTSISDVLAYKSRLQRQNPKVNYLMTLYLHERITPAMVTEAKAHGIVGIKSYPAGVTTNSSFGVISYEPFYPVFAAMEQCGMVLNLHGECPSDPSDPHNDVTVLNAESKFLPTLKSLHAKFPELKIVLEHCTTMAAIQAVQECGPNVVGTITLHHLFLTINDVVNDPFCYCKPVAKDPSDRVALVKAAINGDGKFFMGSDSAPHDITSKKSRNEKVSAGVFTQPYVTQLFLDAIEQAISQEIISENAVSPEILQGFLGEYGRRFYGIVQDKPETIVLHKRKEKVQTSFVGQGLEIIPFRRGQPTWSINWD